MSNRRERAWALSALAAIALAPSAVVAQSGIEYATVEEARRVLSKKPGAVTNTIEEWFIVHESNSVAWSFAPENHAAHPSVAKRTLVEKDGRFFVETQIKCESTKPACDRLLELFRQLDQQLNESFRSGR